MTEQDLRSLRYVIGQLRHTYHNIIHGYVTVPSMKQLAEGLISPQISSLEQIVKNEEKDLARSVAVEPGDEVEGEGNDLAEGFAHMIWNAYEWSSGRAWDTTPERDIGKQKCRALAKEIVRSAVSWMRR